MTDLGSMLVTATIKDVKIEVAKSMLKDKVTIEFVSRHTGLDEAAVKELQAELEAA